METLKIENLEKENNKMTSYVDSVILEDLSIDLSVIKQGPIELSVADLKFPFSQTLEEEPDIMKEEIKILTVDGVRGIPPTRGSTFAACKDLYSPYSLVIPAGERVCIKTNIAIAWDDPEYYMQLLSRSGLSFKNWTDVKAGVIDYDYRENIGVILHNYFDKDLVINAGDRIAQFTYIKIKKEKSTIVEEFTIPLESNRNGGGFGSTGK